MPESWAWCRLGEAGIITDTGYPFDASLFTNDSKNRKQIIRIRDILRGYSETYSDENCPDSYIVNEGDILIGMDGDFNIAKWKTDGALLNQRVCRINKNNELINLDYVFYLLPIPLLEINKNTSSVTVKHLSNKQIENLIFPIPPFNEQNRIINHLENIFSQIRMLEQNKSVLQTAIKQAKSKILDLAIHGKLVPQDPNDESAEELLKRIATSDNRPYKKFEDEVPFEIPDSWAWCTGNDIFNPMTSKKPYGETFRYIDIDAIDNKKHCVIQPKTIAVSEAPSRASRELNNGDVLFSLVRPYLENIALIEKENTDCIASTGFYVCKPKDFIFPKFLFYLMTSEYVIKGLNQFMKGDNSPSINGDDIKNWLYPLPPLAEQQQIVTKIEELFAQLDSISEQIA